MDRERKQIHAKLYSEIVKRKLNFGDINIEVRIILKFSLTLWHSVLIVIYTKRGFLSGGETALDRISAVEES
jgi:hypothetical protein